MGRIHIAASESETYTPPNTFGGEAPIVNEAFTFATGLELAPLTPVALNASNEIVAWDEAGAGTLSVAIGLTVEAVDTTGGAAKNPVYTGGYFDTDAIQWPETSTEAQRLNAFLRTMIKHRAVTTN